MPKATVRANVRALPEATNRRNVLAAALAAGATAALPASAANQSPMLTETDQLVVKLWERRAELIATATCLSEEHDVAYAQLPSWARTGSVYLRPDGSDAEMGAGSSWPVTADLSRRPIDNRGLINARPDPDDLRTEFLVAFGKAADRVSVFEDYGRAFAEFAERCRQQKAEEKRLGVAVLSLRYDAAFKAVADIENEFDRYLGGSIFALAAVLIVAIADECEQIEGLNRAALAAIRPQLSGAIAADVDRTLALHRATNQLRPT